jgi:hypothetical protein
MATPQYQALSASNGSGEAVRATVQAARAIGSTTISVNATTNWPTGPFIATTGTLQANGTLLSTTVQVFYGTASGTAITITSFAPGYTDKGNAINDVVVLKPTTEWANQVQKVIANIYPVGAIYSSTVATNPATVFGFGTWVAFGAGRVMVGAGTSDQAFVAGNTGGESNHTLTQGEMPSHGHVMGLHGSGAESTGYGLTPSASFADRVEVTAGAGLGDSTSSTGGGGAHNNLQPYIVVYMWNRTA